MNLKEARKAARFSQQAAAEHLGMSRPTYDRLERNPDLVTVADAEKLAKLFGRSVDEIFFAGKFN